MGNHTFVHSLDTHTHTHFQIAVTLIHNTHNFCSPKPHIFNTCSYFLWRFTNLFLNNMPGPVFSNFSVLNSIYCLIYRQRILSSLYSKIKTQKGLLRQIWRSPVFCDIVFKNFFLFQGTLICKSFHI